MEQHEAIIKPLMPYRCSRCGSSEKERVKRRVGIVEKMTVLWIPLFVVIGAVLGYFIFIFGMAIIDICDLGEELSLIGLCASSMLIMPAGGAVLGTLLGRKCIRSRRRKQNLSQTTCRCKICKAIFIPENP